MAKPDIAIAQVKPQGIEACFNLPRKGFTLSLDVQLPGQGITAIFGHSGSGKTSFLRCLAGLEPTATGQLMVNGKCWQNQQQFISTHQRSLGYVFQEPSLFEHLNVKANLDYAIKRQRGANTQVAYDELLTLLNIEPLLDRKPQQLSGGEQQRVAIARALLTQPQLLLMDEPMASLDYGMKQELLPYIETLKTELKIPIIYVSHSIEEVSRLADHLLVLKQGVILANGGLVETLADVNLSSYLGDKTGVILPAVIEQKDPQWGLAKARFSGGDLWINDNELVVSQAVRLRVLARDVSLSLQQHTDTSIVNIIEGVITQIQDNQPQGMVLVKVMLADRAVLARITRRSLQHLALHQNKKVWVQIKSAALVR